jgi:hypothetical protein
MKQTQQNNLDEMIEQIVLSSPPSVMVKARFLGQTIRGMYFPPNDFPTFINVNHINEHYEVIEPREYKIYYSPNNTELQSF